MKIHVLVAGPGTGKTSKIIERINKLENTDNLLVISFTNATVKQLRKDIKNRAGKELADDKCTTLHKLALRLASADKQYVLTEKELGLIQRDSKCLGSNYEQICEILNCKDFNQVIRKAINHLKTNPTLVKERLGQIDLLLVDEFQDFNSEEQELITRLAHLTQETWIVGDDDQAIYDFKKANPKGIIDLYNDEEHVKIEHEGICHRCPKDVVTHAFNLIKNNPFRVNKSWQPTEKEGFVCVAQFLTKEEEQAAIVKKIKEITTSEPKASILLLYPNDIALHSLPEKLDAGGIEFRKFVKEMEGLYELRHLLNIYLLRDTFLHLRLLLNLDPSTTKQYYQVIKTDTPVPTTLQEVIVRFNGHKKLTQLVAEVINPLQAFDDESIINLLDLPKFQKAKEIVGETKEVNKIIEKINIYIEDQIELDETGINLMTIHKSKGLEADYVFLMGATDGVLPMIKPGTTMEAQRRLMYVALTRCKKGIFISTAVHWAMEEKLVHKVQKDKFKFDYIKKIYRAQTSPFILEMGCEVKENFDGVVPVSKQLEKDILQLAALAEATTPSVVYAGVPDSKEREEK